MSKRIPKARTESRVARSRSIEDPAPQAAMPLTSGASHAFDDLVEESLDEAAFLWGRWESELVSLTRSLDEVWTWTEDRLHGALDGVRAAGPAFVVAATQAMSSGD